MSDLDFARQIVEIYAQHSIGCCYPMLACDCGLTAALRQLGIRDLKSVFKNKDTTETVDSGQTVYLNWGLQT